MRYKIECPTNFLDLSKYEISLSNDPEVIIVDPGTDKFLDKNYFEKYKNLKIVGTPSTGVNHIDVNYLTNKKVKIFCLLDDREALDSITASAEFTWIHIMNGFRRFSSAKENTQNWRSLENENLLRTNELSEKNILIIGLGRIGKKIKRYALSFDMKVDFYDPHVEDDSIKKIDNLKNIAKYDCISVNCYLNNATRGMINKSVLDRLKEKCILVNTSRGEVVKEDDMTYHILNNENFYFGADVLCNEQDLNHLLNSKLYKLSKKIDRVVITPHVAGATVESQTKAFEAILNLCKSYYV